MQFRIGALVLAFVAGADFGVGSYCLVVDEIVKDRRLVRTKPYQMELDDALALTDDDALARDMFARSSQNDGKSFYMSEVRLVAMQLELVNQGNHTGKVTTL